MRKRWVWCCLFAVLGCCVAYENRAAPPGSGSSIDMAFVYVPEGEAEFIDWKTETGYRERVDGFWISRHEVTVEAYTVFLFYHDDKQHVPLVTPEYREAPVAGISWASAKAFATWCGGTLPTPEQWFKAGYWNPDEGQRMSYPWGASEKVDFHRDRDNQVPVDSYPDDCSAYGALGMAGHPPEWVGEPDDRGGCVAMGYYHKDGRGQWYNRGHANKDCGFRIALKELDLPGMLSKDQQARIRDLAARLGADTHAERERAHHLLRTYGAIAIPVLRDFRRAEDPEVRERIATLLQEGRELKLRFIPEPAGEGVRVSMTAVLPD